MNHNKEDEMPHRIRVQPSTVKQEIAALQKAVNYLDERIDEIDDGFASLVDELREILVPDEEDGHEPLSDEDVVAAAAQMDADTREAEAIEAEEVEGAREARAEAEALIREAQAAQEAERRSFREAEGRRAVGGEVDSDPNVRANQVNVDPDA